MIADRERIFKNIRAAFGPLNQGQVDGINTLLDSVGPVDDRWVAYMLATAWHETDKTMQPIREYGTGKGKKYGRTFYGRGLVQLTWKYNYASAGKRLGLDLVGHPDLALDPVTATKIMAVGMRDGWFTGKKLSDYFDIDTDDPIGARRIINGQDKAKLIAGYHKAFLTALTT